MLLPAVALGLACVLNLAGCGPAPNPKPLAELTPDETSGHAVYQANCAVCHYDRQNGKLQGPSLSSVFKKPALPSGAATTDERVSATVLHGHGSMPALGNRVDDEDLRVLLAYLHTL